MDEVWSGPIADEPHTYPVVDQVIGFEGLKWTIVSDRVQINEHLVTRDVLRHPGAVAVIARDDQGRILLIRQYRHPVKAFMWEIPAGLLDVPGEDPIECAKRELVEEAGLEADVWSRITTLALTPGGSDELIHIYRADGVREVGRQVTGEAEEADLPRAWVPLQQAVGLCLAGSISNATAVAAILALAAADR